MFLKGNKTHYVKTSPARGGSTGVQLGAFPHVLPGCSPSVPASLIKEKSSEKLEERTVHRAATAKPTLGGNDIPLGTRLSQTTRSDDLPRALEAGLGLGLA